MKPKEKAIELVDIFFLPLEESLNANVNSKRKEIAKKHALICIDEIMNLFTESTPKDDVYFYLMNLEYWQEVKEEINKI